MKKVRSKFGNDALEANEVVLNIFRAKNNGDSIYLFVADQTPHFSHVSYGLEFLNQRTPAFIGYDKLATRMDLIFIYCEMKKVKRGFYQINYHRVMPDGEKFAKNEVVRKFHKLLENTLHKRPDNYLWSHRKWKYQDSIKDFDSEKIQMNMSKKLAVAILNWNGKNWLEKFLPSVVKFSQNADIYVIDKIGRAHV